MDCDGRLWAANQIDNKAYQVESGETTTQCNPGLQLPWLSLNKYSGTLPAHGTTTITMTFDPKGLAAGEYTGALRIKSDSPYGFITVPVTMTAVSNPLLINGGDSCTTKGAVILTIARQDSSYTEICVNNTGVMCKADSATGWKAYKTPFSWSLPAPKDQGKTVYLWFRAGGKGGTTDGPYLDTIHYGTTCPSGSFAGGEKEIHLDSAAGTH